ncbi:MAG: hypothetical protein GF334_09440 [Candidatus Altiarchaeales archaeon]|nr:hypothetical protein [Candidatus Altiarchaeales archaeon]
MPKYHTIGELLNTETGEVTPLECILVETEDDLRAALGMPSAKCEGCEYEHDPYAPCEEYGCVKSPETRVGRMFSER